MIISSGLPGSLRRRGMGVQIAEQAAEGQVLLLA
jgi:hypothetical protein